MGLNIEQPVITLFHYMYYIKEQMISPVPDVRTLQLDHTKDSYIVLACDGIWNSLTSQEVVDFVSERLDKLQADETSKDPTSQQLQTICEEVSPQSLISLLS